jgi:hypothetical protein
MPLAVWTGPVVGSLIISICALIGSAISIVWQIYTWRHNGPRVTVKAAHAVTAGPIGRQDFIAITAANDGRASTIAHQFGFKLPNDRIFVQPLSELPVELPAELKPGGEVTYYFSRKGLQRAAAKENWEPKDLRPFVKTGHGEVVGSALKSI